MTTHTNRTVVHFASAFRLPGFDVLQPAGECRVDHDEEAIDGVSRIAWRRVGSFTHLPAITAQGSTQQMVSINSAEIEAALAKDSEQT